MSDTATPEKNPYFDIAVVEHLFSLLAQMEIELDDDPLLYGPKRLNQKIAEAQKLRMACANLDMKVSRFLSRLSRQLHATELEFDIRKRELMAADPEVRAQRNLSMQESTAIMKLVDDFRDLFYLQEAVREMNDVLKVIKFRHSVITDAQKRIKEQQRMCEREIDLGSYWGSRHPKAKKLKFAPISGGIDDLVEEAEKEFLAAKHQREASSEDDDEAEDNPTQEDVDDFLEELEEVETPVVELDEDVDIHDLLG